MLKELQATPDRTTVKLLEVVFQRVFTRIYFALFGLFPMALLSAAIFPLHPGMTKYAMRVLKSSVHSCFFCYELRRTSLEEEISFLERRLGSNRTLIQLLALRREYRNSFTFVVRCIPIFPAPGRHGAIAALSSWLPGVAV